MPKKIIVSEKGLIKFFKSFLNAKKSGKEPEWRQSLQKKMKPGYVPNWLDVFESDFKRQLLNRRVIQALGGDTTKIDNVIKSAGYTIPSEKEIAQILGSPPPKGIKI